MSDAAPTTASSGRRRWPKRATLLVQYLLLQPFIIVLCLVVLRIPPPEPSPRYLVTDFSLRENGVEQSVTLPHFIASRYTMNDPPLYSGRFTWRGGEPQEAWSVLLPRFTNGVEVAVNGVVILDSRRNPAANRPDRNTPEIAVIPASLLRDGANDLSIRLFVWGPIRGFLDRLYVGPDAELRPSYNARTLLFVTLPVVFSAWQAILAVILGIMWVMRRHEPAYGVLAAAMAIGVAQAFFQTPLQDFGVLQAELDADLRGAAGKRVRADLRAAVLRLEMAALRLADLRARPCGRGRGNGRRCDAEPRSLFCWSARRRSACVSSRWRWWPATRCGGGRTRPASCWAAR